MSEVSMYIYLLIAMLATVATRFLGPLVYSKLKTLPSRQDFLSRVLPLIIIFTLILNDVLPDPGQISNKDGYLKLIGICIVALLHTFNGRRNMLLSIVGGTAFYIALLNLIS